MSTTNSSANDSLSGGNGNDSLDGGAGDDTLDAGSGDDTLEGGVGNDALWGGYGNDSYLMYRGMGQDTVAEYFGVDRVQVAADIHPTDLTVRRDLQNIYLRINGTTDQLTLPSSFWTEERRIEQIQFADGTIWDFASLTAMAQPAATQGNDTLFGTLGADTIDGLDGNDNIRGESGDDRLNGGAGADSLYGGTGNDTLDGGPGDDWLEDNVWSSQDGGDNTYLMYRGMGQDRILEASSDNGSGVPDHDTIQVATDIDPADIVLTRVWNDLRLSIRGTSDTLTIALWFGNGAGSGDGSAYRIETIAFADGTRWSSDAITAEILSRPATNAADVLYGDTNNNLLNGLDGEDTLIAFAGVDTLDGGVGNDQLDGGEGSDSYLMYRGMGIDTISEFYGYSGVDTIVLAAGLQSADIAVTRDLDWVYLSIRGTNDRFAFSRGWGPYTIERVQFADATSWDATMLQTIATMDATPAADSLFGDDVANTINGLEGNDTITAYAGDDSLIGGVGDDVLRAGSGSDTLDGGMGNDRLEGGRGNDTYLMTRNAGQDLLSDFDDTPSNIDTLQLATDISASDLAITRDQHHLYLALNNTNDKMTLSNWFDAAAYQIEYVQFADGTRWDANTVMRKMLRSTATENADLLWSDSIVNTVSGLAGNDTLMGYWGDDLLDGGGGNDALMGAAGEDLLSGGEGNDVLDGGTGNDFLNGDAGSDIYLFGHGSADDIIYNYDISLDKIDVIQFTQDVQASEVGVRRSNYDLVLAIDASGDTLTVQNYFNNDAAGPYKVEQMRFADNTVWDINTIKNKVITGTAGADTLIGYASHDRITGGENHDLINGGAGHDSLFGGAGNDTLEGGSGNDLLEGNGGSDTYRFSGTFAQDSINNFDAEPNQIDVIEFTGGILSSDITLRRSANHLVLSQNNTTNTVTVQNYFNNDGASADHIEAIRFSDNTIWDVTTVKQKVLLASAAADSLSGYESNDTINGLAGNDTMIANAGDDLLTGGAGNDSLDGGAGSDVYFFSSGFGQDTINNFDSANDKVDVIQFAAGISGNDVSLRRSGDNLLLSIGNSDRITVRSYFNSDATGPYKIEQIRFADNTIWTIDTVKNKALLGSSGADTLIGYANNDSISGGAGPDTINGNPGDDLLDGGVGNDSLNGGTGNDTLNGGDGNDSLDGGAGNDLLSGGANSDTYRLSAFFGQDLINNFDSGNNKIDVIQLPVGLLPSDVSLQRVNDDLVLSLNNSDHRLTVQNYFNGDATGPYRVEQIKFANNTIWDVTTVKANIATQVIAQRVQQVNNDLSASLENLARLAPDTLENQLHNRQAPITAAYNIVLDHTLGRSAATNRIQRSRLEDELRQLARNFDHQQHDARVALVDRLPPNTPSDFAATFSTLPVSQRAAWQDLEALLGEVQADLAAVASAAQTSINSSSNALSATLNTLSARLNQNAAQLAHHVTQNLGQLFTHLLATADSNLSVTRQELLQTLLNIDPNQLSNLAFAEISAQASSYINTVLPQSIEQILDTHNLDNTAERVVLQNRLTSIVADQLQQLVDNIIPSQLSEILQNMSATTIAQSDFTQVIQQLQQGLSFELGVYQTINLPDQLHDLLTQVDVQNAIPGDRQIFEQQLIQALTNQLAQPIAIWINHPSVAQAMQSDQREQLNGQIADLLLSKTRNYLNSALPAVINRMLAAPDRDAQIISGQQIQLADQIQQTFIAQLGDELQTQLSAQIAQLQLSAAQLQGVVSDHGASDTPIITDRLEEILAAQITKFVDEQLASQIALLCTQDQITALIQGNTDWLETRLTAELQQQLRQYQQQLSTNQANKSLFELRDHLEQQLAVVTERITQTQTGLETYQQLVNQLVVNQRQSLDTTLSAYLAVDQTPLQTLKTQLVDATNTLTQQLASSDPLIAGQFKALIDRQSTQLEQLPQLALDSASLPWAQGIDRLLNHSPSLQQTLEPAFLDSASGYQNKINQANQIANQLQIIATRSSLMQSVLSTLALSAASSLNRDYVKKLIIQRINELTPSPSAVDRNLLLTLIADTRDLLQNRLRIISGSAGDSTLIATTGPDYIIDNAGNDVITASAGNDYIEAGSGNDRIDAGDGADDLSGGAGNDTLIGGADNDTYLFSTNNGQDLIRSDGARSGEVDTIQFSAEFTREKIWFTRVGQDLQVSEIASANRMTIQNWYADPQTPAHHAVQRFALASGQVALAAQVDLLVQAMAAFSPPAMGESSLPSDLGNALAPVLAANWN